MKQDSSCVLTAYSCIIFLSFCLFALQVSMDIRLARFFSITFLVSWELSWSSQWYGLRRSLSFFSITLLPDSMCARILKQKDSISMPLWARGRERESNINVSNYKQLTLVRIERNTQTHCTKFPHFPFHNNCKNYYLLVEQCNCGEEVKCSFMIASL